MIDALDPFCGKAVGPCLDECGLEVGSQSRQLALVVVRRIRFREWLVLHVPALPAFAPSGVAELHRRMARTCSRWLHRTARRRSRSLPSLGQSGEPGSAAHKHRARRRPPQRLAWRWAAASASRESPTTRTALQSYRLPSREVMHITMTRDFGRNLALQKRPGSASFRVDSGWSSLALISAVLGAAGPRSLCAGLRRGCGTWWRWEPRSPCTATAPIALVTAPGGQHLRSHISVQPRRQADRAPPQLTRPVPTPARPRPAGGIRSPGRTGVSSRLRARGCRWHRRRTG
jgi:hypothetical protein